MPGWGGAGEGAAIFTSVQQARISTAVPTALSCQELPAYRLAPPPLSALQPSPATRSGLLGSDRGPARTVGIREFWDYR